MKTAVAARTGESGAGADPDAHARGGADIGIGVGLGGGCRSGGRLAAHEPDQVVVPWGATLAQISEALTVIAGAWEPSWAPA